MTHDSTPAPTVNPPTGPRSREPPANAPKAPRTRSPPADAPSAPRTDRRPQPTRSRTRFRSELRSRRRRRTGSLPRYDSYTPLEADTWAPSKKAERRRSRSCSRDRSSREKHSRHEFPSRRRGRSRSRSRHYSPARVSPRRASPRRHRSTSRSRREIPSYDDSPEMRPKRNHEKILEAFEVQDEIKKKMRLDKEAPKVNVLEHKPALSYDNQSDDGFMDLESLIASVPKQTTIVATSTTTACGPSEVVAGIHPDRIRRLSNDMDMDDDFTPTFQPFVPQVGSNALPVGSRTSKPKSLTLGGSMPIPAQTAQPLARLLEPRLDAPNTQPVVTMSSASEVLGSWGPDEESEQPASGPSAGQVLDSLGPGTDDLPPSSTFGAGSNLGSFGSSAGKTPAPSSFGVGPNLGAPNSSATMGPPPRVTAPPNLRPAPIVLDGRTRQEIFDDFCQEKDNIIYADEKRRKANGTLPFTVCKEEFDLILYRTSFVPSKLALATIDFSLKPGESFLKHESDRKFMVKGRLNERGSPLTDADEEVATFEKINELGKQAIMRMIQTKPGPEKLVGRFERKAQRYKVKRTPPVLSPIPKSKDKEDTKTNTKVNVKGTTIGSSPLKVVYVATSSISTRQDDFEAKALADIGIDVDMEL